MPAVLRASGRDFDVDAFVADSTWEIERVFRRGEPRLPKTRPGGRRHEASGLNVVVSEADLHQFEAQLTDAVEFLTRSAAEVRRLAAFPGVTSVVVDFGIAWRDGAAESNRFPAELVRLAGTFGIALELSHYPASNGGRPRGREATTDAAPDRSSERREA